MCRGGPASTFPGTLLAEGLNGAVAREHVQVVDVDVGLPVGPAHLGGVDVAQPVVGDHLARGVQDQPAQGVALVRVGGHPPVGPVQVLVHRGRHVHQGPAVLAQALVLLAVDDVGAGRGQVVGADQGLLDHVLDALDLRNAARESPVGKDLDHLGREQARLVRAVLARGRARPGDGRLDTDGVEGHLGAVALAHAHGEVGEGGGAAAHEAPPALSCG